MITRKLVVVPPASGVTRRYLHRVFDLYRTTAGNDICPYLTVHGDGVGLRIVGVLRKAITSDLVFRVNKAGSPLITITIPLATAIGTPIEETTFASDPQPFTDGEVLTGDIVSSSGEMDRDGVASFTLEWVG